MNNTIPAVDKTLRFLQALAERPRTQAELSGEFRIAMSTAYRILTTLQSRDWVRKDGAVYSLSTGLMPLVRAFDPEMELLKRAKVQAGRISRGRNIACKLSVRHGVYQQTCYREEPPGPFSLTGEVGTQFPIFEGSVGAALLADESEEAVRALIGESTMALPETAEPELVLERIHEVREKGTVLNLRRNRWGIAAMSIPIRDRRGGVAAALTLVGSRSDFSGRRRGEWDRVLKDAVREIEG